MQPSQSATERPIRVLYSFPNKLGADRICNTAWQQVNGLALAGADILAFPGVLHRTFPTNVKVQPTLSRGKLRIPYKLLGRMRSCALHDQIVANRIKKLADRIDIVHTWPLGAEKTLEAAARLGIPTILERPNAHTQFAYEVVENECRQLGIVMPPGHEHAFDHAILAREQREYALADWLLCPSDFVARTFRERGFPADKLARSQYGFDETLYHPATSPRPDHEGLTFLFAGGCAPRKGLHHALNAWLQSAASQSGSFVIAGGFIPGYAEVMARQLAHPRVKVLGHRKDLPDLMRNSDVLVLPSIEEGSALVTYEARGSGCVLLVSDAAGAVCTHGENALVHAAGDVRTLSQQMTQLHQDRALLEKLRSASLKTVHQLTWKAAGEKLLEVYRWVLDTHKKSNRRVESPAHQIFAH